MGLLFIVRRGALRRFDRLKQAAADLPVDVIWDRRTKPAGKPAAPREESPRAADRRQQASFTWKHADFVVVDEDPDEPAR
jgi:hypothetical protein